MSAQVIELTEEEKARESRIGDIEISFIGDDISSTSGIGMIILLFLTSVPTAFIINTVSEMHGVLNYVLGGILAIVLFILAFIIQHYLSKPYYKVIRRAAEKYKELSDDLKESKSLNDWLMDNLDDLGRDSPAMFDKIQSIRESYRDQKFAYEDSKRKK